MSIKTELENYIKNTEKLIEQDIQKILPGNTKATIKLEIRLNYKATRVIEPINSIDDLIKTAQTDDDRTEIINQINKLTDNKEKTRLMKLLKGLNDASN